MTSKLFLALGVLSTLCTPIIADGCTGQSCWIADLSTSTGRPYALKDGKKAGGGDARGDDCIRKCLTKLGAPQAPGLKTGKYGAETELCTAVGKQKIRRVTLEERQSCKKNILLFGRGTTEPQGLGTVGNPLSKAAGSDWASEAIVYNANLMGINCVGLPGGTKCVEQLNRLASKCPNSKIVVGGYSQGAMVARICVAYASEQAKKQVAGLVLFGDPFNGAPIKGYPQEKIKDYCDPTDGVCEGKLAISLGHMSYNSASRAGRGTDVADAAKWMNAAVRR